MTYSTTNIRTVPFHGHDLFLVEHEGQPYTPMKAIVEGMGLDWSAQARKLRDNRSRWGMVNLTIPSLDPHNAASCLPVRKLPGWMASISPKKIKSEDVRNKVIQYQDECDDALWSYWTQGVAINPRITLTPAHQRELQKAIASRVYAQVPEARRPSAFKRLYRHLKDRFEVGSYKDIDESRYTEALGAIQSCELEGEWFAADQDREGLDMALDESDQQALFLMLSHAYWIHRIWRDENIEAALRMLGSPLAGRMHEHLSTADMCRRKLVSRHGDALYEMRKRAGCFEPPLSLH